MAKYFHGLSLISGAGIVSETFIKLGTAWRIGLIAFLLGSFALGLLFAKADNGKQTEED